LATVIDCHTRCVIGWSMASHLRTSLVCDALTMAAGNVPFAAGVVFHSDRGTQLGFKESMQHRWCGAMLGDR
jgi:putative transposase